MRTSKIIASVSKALDVSVEQMKSHCRKRDIVDARRMAIGMIRDECTPRKRTKDKNISLMKIGDIFGGRDYSTVIYSIDTYEDLKRSDRKFQAKYNRVLEALK